MAGLPVAKLNSLGRVRVGFTACITRYYNLLQKISNSGNFPPEANMLSKLTGGLTGRVCLIIG